VTTICLVQPPPNRGACQRVHLCVCVLRCALYSVLQCVAVCFLVTGIFYLARRSKYHLSIWPLSRGELIPRLDEFIFFLVSQFLLQVLSRSFAPLPSFLDFSSFFPHPGRGIFPSLSGFTTHACFLKRCAQCYWAWVSILSTNPFCGLLHSHHQGISRFPQIGVVFLTFKKFVPPNRKHKNFRTPSLSFDQWAKKTHASQIG